MSELRGSCQCGTVTYEVADAFEYAINCHCSLCRRTTGAAFKPIAGIPAAKLRITAGQDAIRVIGAAGWHDERCSACGSFLYAVVREGAYVHVAMGTLIDTPTIRPTAHIFVGSKAGWYTITDDLPQYDGHVV
ncbi:GFA family protein [Novosphingobium sp.]|uniref:GFA family protein n=1 Tax=Novosphingobium sp. TaxID=1874826 RepID=UPI003B52C8F4